MPQNNLTYTEAIAAIDKILDQIENGELDVDELAAKVKIASELLKFCKSKLFKTSKDIEKVLKDLEQNEAGE